ncbi:MAG: DUF3244 domain-containing protein [Prevotella sp.]|nr:DUF3244 domain-containing protein [Prevotella sp.]
MKKIALLFTILLLPVLASAHVFGNADPKESIYGEWWLVGWNDGGNWFEADNNYVGYHSLSVEIPKEGYMMAYSMVNEIFVGLLTLRGNEMIFDGKDRCVMTQVNCDITENLFFEDHICGIMFYQLDGNLLRLYYTDNDYFVFTSVINDSEGQTEDYYRPFIEEDKVWKVGYGNRNPIQFVEYYYFEGDTIIDGRTCKQMMCQRYVTPDYSDYEVIMRYPLLRRSGVWYEEDKKVYEYNTTDKQFKLMYDFSVDDNATLQIHGQSYVVGPKLTEGLKGFKGVYRNVMWPSWDGEQIYDEGHHNTTWLEGVGSIEGPGYNVYLGKEYHGGAFLMACTVGDEVIYFNGEYEDGATPEEVVGVRKDRIDFTHTIKIKPKSRTAREAEAKSLYGEYNSQQLGLNLNALDEAYQVSITDDTGKAVYEKTVNAGSIVGLNIDISAYAKGRYTVTVENSNELFTGQFETQTTGIEENVRIEKFKNGSIYNLQGQRINSLRKGMNIVRSAEGRLQGKKVFVK